MSLPRLFLAIAAIAVLAAGAYWIVDGPTVGTPASAVRVAVQTQPVEHGALEDVREFSGSLEAHAVLTVAPKIAGQIESVAADIGDRITPGDRLVTLDDDEYRQALAEAEAGLEVARAQLAQARSDAGTASRSLRRVRSLHERGIAATAELDAAEADAANANANASVARATISEAQAQVETARVRLGYTDIRAHWPGDDAERVVGERMAEPGDTVAANTPLLRIVSITPLTAIIQVPEQLYTRLRHGQGARLRVAGAADAAFEARIERIAPVFDPATRRARVELAVPNAEHRLAPGMFVQVGLVAERLDDTAIVPRTALVTRGGRQGVFMVQSGDAGGAIARFTPVSVAFTNGARAALHEPADLSGEVVTLGQAQLEDGIGIAPDGPTDDAP
ncbi:efflux RND transporter periplasmic adaptor subunit [Salinisphaera aquimarina]|uniref:Efflux RND transporter periplasmic adaptor subunit n=1 Tax=Salinisphaera aquimarina TaxID=2094031 RepID=A0ABV7EN26_9GAMM